MITAVKENIIIEPEEMTTQGGLFVPNTNDNILRGKVIAAGLKVDEVVVGNTVVVAKHSTLEIEVENKKYWVTTEDKILAVIKE